jgi:hypothetical protein
MINVPQPTVEKPLTPVDYIAALSECDNTQEVHIFCELVPMKVAGDERFAKAVQAKLVEIRDQNRKSA